MSKFQNKTVFISGGTSGIGKATAQLFAKEGYKLVLCGRRQERLDALSQELNSVTQTTALNFDVRERDTVLDAINSLPRDFSKIDILVNNAGNAHGLDEAQTASLDDWDAMIDINVKGLLYVTKAVLPGMIKRDAGHIINIGSLAGKEVYPKGSVYCASKHAVDAINQGLRMDLNEHNIRVAAINPGLVETEFSEVRFKGDKNRANTVYEGYKALQAEDIAEIIHFVVTRPSHVNIADLLVLPSAQASSVQVKKEL